MGEIKAVVTMHKQQVGGGAPIFVADNVKQMEETAFLLEKLLDAAVHDLKNGTFILVKHK
ncbi:capping complex subunit for YIEGIA [Paenibacillus abyssi]|uniref:Uncharacterized protein n=1 Tax=Paenibacillus abyssi TaxID=1340531 RepID=A0A917FIV2_9BACL|nr:hypothetical protein [Paenibacillus abyssi]GGF87797.1 hypothetical protein GCM10010916_01400 [Paenibacillus abyssi]